MEGVSGALADCDVGICHGVCKRRDCTGRLGTELADETAQKRSARFFCVHRICNEGRQMSEQFDKTQSPGGELISNRSRTRTRTRTKSKRVDEEEKEDEEGWCGS